MFSIASSMSPLASVSAFLQSIMPAPVRSRSSFTRGCGNFSHSKILGDVICPALNRTDIKVKKGGHMQAPLTKRVLPGSIRALPLHISRRRCVIFARSSRSLTDVSSREFSSLPPFCNSNYFGGVIKPYYSASTKLSSALGSQILRTAFTYGCSNSAQVQGHSTDCVVVTRDNEVNTVRIRVGINDSKYRNTQGCLLL